MSLHGVALRVKQLVNPTTPATGQNILYPKSDGKWYTKDSAGVETVVGAGAGGPPSGTAGGSLSGTYPNPLLAANAVSGSHIVNGSVSGFKIAAGAVDNVHLADQAVDSRVLADSTVTSAKINDGTIVHGDIAAANKDGAAATPSLRTLGTGAQQAVAGNDARLSDARTPLAHTHTKANITDFAHTHHINDLTATGTKDATTFLRGDNTWAVPAGGGGGAEVYVQPDEPTDLDEGTLWFDEDEPSLSGEGFTAGCELTHSVAQTIPNNADTAVTFDTEYFDSGGLHTSGSPTRITIPVGGEGIWSFAYNLAFQVNATAGNLPRAAYLRVDGSSADRRALCQTWASGTFDSTLVGAHICRLAAGQYIELIAYQSSGAGLAVKGSNSAAHILSFSAVRIGGA